MNQIKIYLKNLHALTDRLSSFKSLESVAMLGILIIITWPKHEAFALPGLDGSYFTMLNYWAAHDLQKLQHIQYTYGPLGFLKNYLAFGDNILWGILINVILRLSLGSVIIAWIKPRLGAMLSYLLLLLILLIFPFDFYFYFIVFLICWKSRSETGYLYSVLIAMAVMLAILVKVNIALNSLLIVFPFWLRKASLSHWRQVAAIPEFIMALYFSSWLIMFGSFKGSIDLLIGYAAFIANNNTTTLFAPNNHLLLLIMIMSLIGLILLSKKEHDQYLILPFLSIFLFAEFKYSFNRHESGHIYEWYLVLIFITILYLIHESKFNWIKVLLAIIMISSFALNLKINGNFPESKLKLSLNGIWNFHDEVVNYKSYKARNQKQSNRKLGGIYLHPSVLEAIGEKTIDFFPWELSYAAKYRLNYVPRAGLQSFGLHNYFVDKNSDLINTADAPEFILWQTKKWHGQLGGIDNQYLLNNDGQYLISLLSNYYRKTNLTGKILLQKDSSQSLTELSRVSQTAKWFENIHTPAIRNNEFFRARVSVKSGFGRAIKSAFYKARLPRIVYGLKNGRELTYEFSTSDGKKGLWIGPYISQINPEVIAEDVEYIRFEYSENDPPFRDNIQIEWIRYSHTRESIL